MTDPPERFRSVSKAPEAPDIAPVPATERGPARQRGRRPRYSVWALACLLLAGAALAVAVPLTGLGSSDVLTPQALASAADKTAATGGVRLSLRQTISHGGRGTIPTTAEGRFDNTSGRGEMTLTMDVSSMPGGASAGGGTIEQHLIFDGLTFYMSSPAFDRALPAGKRWIKLDLAAVGEQAGIDLAALTRVSGQDPTQSLHYLKAVSGDVTRIGTDTVRGVPTTRYRATIDFDKVPDALPAAQRSAVRRSMQQIIELSDTSKLPMEIWIGDDDIVRRMTHTVTTSTAGQRTTITQRIELYDFGTKVDVEIPPADQAIDPASLADAQRGTVSG
ncbi:MAG: hypothetical protein Q8O56_01140 [Solirubrobacteraceae bacterium]|nr:hypothetical protein [Solirubrobacteraceae bacterium]